MVLPRNGSDSCARDAVSEASRDIAAIAIEATPVIIRNMPLLQVRSDRASLAPTHARSWFSVKSSAIRARRPRVEQATPYRSGRPSLRLHDAVGATMDTRAVEASTARGPRKPRVSASSSRSGHRRRSEPLRSNSRGTSARAGGQSRPSVKMRRCVAAAKEAASTRAIAATGVIANAQVAHIREERGLRGAQPS